MEQSFNYAFLWLLFFSVWVFVVHLCGLGFGSTQNKADCLSYPPGNFKKNSSSLCRCTSGWAEMICGWFLMKETIKNQFEQWLFYQVTRTQIAKTLWQRFVADYVDICVLTKEMWCIKMDYQCLKAERSLLELKARIVTSVVCDNASFLSSVIAKHFVSVRKMWQEWMFVKEKYAVDLISLQIHFHSNITFMSRLSILPLKTKRTCFVLGVSTRYD